MLKIEKNEVLMILRIVKTKQDKILQYILEKKIVYKCFQLFYTNNMSNENR